MERSSRFIFLYAGLALLVSVLLLRCFLSRELYLIMLFAAIAMKSLFLFLTLKSGGFRFPWGLRLIVAGVVMILSASLVRRGGFPDWLYQLLFYGAIILKSAGLLLTLRRNPRR